MERINDSYELMDISIKDFVKEFYKEYPDLLKYRKLEAELLYSRHIQSIKEKFTSEEREFLLMVLKGQFEINKGAIVRTFTVAAIYVAVVSIVKDWGSEELMKLYFQFITVSSILFIMIYIIISEINYVKYNNKISKIISIFEYIKRFEE